MEELEILTKLQRQADLLMIETCSPVEAKLANIVAILISILKKQYAQPMDNDIAAAVAAAVAGERERCAKIADEHGRIAIGHANSDPTGDALEMAKSIAEVIRRVD